MSHLRTACCQNPDWVWSCECHQNGKCRTCGFGIGASPCECSTPSVTYVYEVL